MSCKWSVGSISPWVAAGRCQCRLTPTWFSWYGTHMLSQTLRVPDSQRCLYEFNKKDGGCTRYNGRNIVFAASQRDYLYRLTMWESRHRMREWDNKMRLSILRRSTSNLTLYQRLIGSVSLHFACNPSPPASSWYELIFPSYYTPPTATSVKRNQVISAPSQTTNPRSEARVLSCDHYASAIYSYKIMSKAIKKRLRET